MGLLREGFLGLSNFFLFILLSAFGRGGSILFAFGMMCMILGVEL